MKRETVSRILLMFFLAFGIFLPSKAMGEDPYVFINSDSDYGDIYLNVKSASDRGNYVVCWEKVVPRGSFLQYLKKQLKPKTPDYLMTLYAYDKKASRMQVLQGVVYDAGRNPIKTIISITFNERNYVEIVPDTVGYVQRILTLRQVGIQP